MFNKNNFAINKFCARGYNNIFVAPDKTIALDGRCAVQISKTNYKPEYYPAIEERSHSENFPPITITKKQGKEIERIAKKFAKNKILESIIYQESEKIFEGEIDKGKFCSTDLENVSIVPVKTTGENFPDITKVWPEYNGNSVKVTVNAKTLKEIAGLADSVSDHELLTISVIDSNTAIQITANNSENGQEMKAILMPCRSQNMEKEKEEYKKGKIEKIEEQIAEWMVLEYIWAEEEKV